MFLNITKNNEYHTHLFWIKHGCKGFSNTSQSKRHDDVNADWIHVAQNKVQMWTIVDVPLIP